MSDNNNTESNNKKTISLLARYDAAMNTRHTAKHWSYADFKSADLDASYEVRRNLRIRARYEVQNNSYAKGICSTVGNGEKWRDFDGLEWRTRHPGRKWPPPISLGLQGA